MKQIRDLGLLAFKMSLPIPSISVDTKSIVGGALCTCTSILVVDEGALPTGHVSALIVDD